MFFFHIQCYIRGAKCCLDEGREVAISQFQMIPWLGCYCGLCRILMQKEDTTGSFSFSSLNSHWGNRIITQLLPTLDHIWPSAKGNEIMLEVSLKLLQNTMTPMATVSPSLIEIRLCVQACLLFPSGEYGSIWYLNGSNCVDLFMLWVFSATQTDRQVSGSTYLWG